MNLSKILFLLFSGINTRIKGKAKANNSRDYFKLLRLLGVKNFRTNFFGLRFDLDPLNSSVSSRLYLENEFENSSIENFINLIPAEGIFLDIGGNIGLYSCIVAEKFPNLQVFTFEPANHVFRTLLLNTESFSNVFPLNFGLSEKNDIQTFYEYEDDALSSFVPANRSQLVRTTRTMTMNGDDFIKSYGLSNVTSIKIDVEGFELHVLKGLMTTLQSNNPIIQIELIYENQEAHDCFNLLTSIGYLAYYWEDNELKVCSKLLSNEYNYIFKK